MKNKKNYVYGSFACKSDIGRVRTTNEDRTGAFTNAKGNILLILSCSNLNDTTSVKLTPRASALLHTAATDLVEICREAAIALCDIFVCRSSRMSFTSILSAIFMASFVYIRGLASTYIIHEVRSTSELLRSSCGLVFSLPRIDVFLPAD